ncbi:hypothetical protein GO639_10740 [Staphylococcus aureus]|nr:hypothetical protein [Staphylococcus aureus]
MKYKVFWWITIYILKITIQKKQLPGVLQTKTFEKVYAQESIAEMYGHTILRLPPYFCVFNPIDLVWGKLKQSINRKNNFPKFDKG